MQSPSKSKREMFSAFINKFPDVPNIFIARSLDYQNNLGTCFDYIMDYKKNAIQEFNVNQNKWLSKNL